MRSTMPTRNGTKKPAAFVGYGSVGAARAIEQLRLIAVELQIAPIRTGVPIQGAGFMAGLEGVGKGERHTGEFPYRRRTATDILAQLAWGRSALKTAREQPLVPAAA